MTNVRKSGKKRKDKKVKKTNLRLKNDISALVIEIVLIHLFLKSSMCPIKAFDPLMSHIPSLSLDAPFLKKNLLVPFVYKHVTFLKTYGYLPFKSFDPALINAQF